VYRKPPVRFVWEFLTSSQQKGPRYQYRLKRRINRLFGRPAGLYVSHARQQTNRRSRRALQCRPSPYTVSYDIILSRRARGGTECFDDYFPCRKKNCKLKHVQKWLNLFAYHYKRENILTLQSRYTTVRYGIPYSRARTTLIHFKFHVTDN
jgi:hypothetical protein